MYAIIVAAGSGQRFVSDTPKQFLEIAGKLAIQHSIDAFADVDAIEAIVLVMPKNQSLWQNIELTASKPLIYTKGGSTRVESVLHGLETLAPSINDKVGDNSWILVHDAARACIAKSDIEKLIYNCNTKNQGGLLVKPINDTIKYSEDGENITKTIDRSKLTAALTPQMFPYKQLKSILQNINSKLITDESSAFEQAGIKPLMVKGRSDNIKITYAEDLLLAEFILRKKVCQST
ncbi:2-C-methyl-D-erythritol 4-phosphate cytidylyltransferase [hydrothermal vent metagenome]|uniref:2-C-methyl-D-erythritol 4-phosphate cytidylyltransferase n=1 Tax=hydrothermal vent metagenome TaxID=652676 RepID=A0A3B0V8M4_9ZZZZ